MACRRHTFSSSFHEGRLLVKYSKYFRMAVKPWICKSEPERMQKCLRRKNSLSCFWLVTKHLRAYTYRLCGYRWSRFQTLITQIFAPQTVCGSAQARSATPGWAEMETTSASCPSFFSPVSSKPPHHSQLNWSSSDQTGLLCLSASHIHTTTCRQVHREKRRCL